MFRRSRVLLLGLATTLMGLTGCSTYVSEQRPAWRAEAENACLAQGVVHETPYLRPAQGIDGPGICGLTHPFKVTALVDGTVTLNSTQTLDCSMIAALDGWIKDVVQPAAMARFGEKVVRLNSMGSYSCRGINNMSGANLSEHSFGNAIDIGGFVLESGRELNIMRGFNGTDPQESAFLHEAHAGACASFTTVLGPGYNVFHYNHFHVDLAMHGSTSHGPRRYCKPVPQGGLPDPPRKDDLPDPPPIEEEMDVARAPMPPPSIGSASLLASVPAAALTARKDGAAHALMPGGFSPAPGRPTAPRDATVLARAPSAEPSPTRARPKPPAPTAPLVSFAPESDAGYDMPAPQRESPRPRPPRALGAERPPAAEDVAPPDAEPASAGGVGEGQDASGSELDGIGEPAVAPPAAILQRRPPEGAPSDWDLTSSTRP